MGLSGIYRHDIVVVGMPVVARPIIVHGERLRCQLTTMLAGCTVDFKDQMQNECKAAACFAHKIEIGSSAVCVGHVSGPKGKVTVSHSCLAMVDTVPLNEDGSLHVESSHFDQFTLRLSTISTMLRISPRYDTAITSESCKRPGCASQLQDFVQLRLH